MARGRIITPEFWTDGNIIGLSFAARLFYIGLWNFAFCDKGHLPDDVLGLKLKVLPADDVDAKALMGELIAAGRVVRLDADGKSFLVIPTFESHQKQDVRWKSRCPACALQDSLKLTETLPSLGEHSETLPNSALRGEERNGEEGREEEPGDEITDADLLCNSLAQLIVQNGSKRPVITDRWRTEARLLLDKDGREFDSALRLMHWCQADAFWKANVLSMPTFRQKYDQLRLAANRELDSRRTTAAVKNLSTVAYFEEQETRKEIGA